MLRDSYLGEIADIFIGFKNIDISEAWVIMAIFLNY